MSRRIERSLSDEDRVLWNLIARSATPLKGRRLAVAIEGTQPIMAEVIAEAHPAMVKAVPSAAPASPKKQIVSTHFDRPTHDKVAAGRLPIGGRVDLHGMTQDQAYVLLLSFLGRAHANGVRYVLVITGKGSSSGGDGVLRRALPSWLATAPFRTLVSSHDNAARRHGGDGAIYVRLRKHPR